MYIKVYMNFVSTTELRTKSSELIKSLKKGESVSLIHRSKVVGVIKPAQTESKVFTAEKIKELERAVEELNLPRTSYAEREKRYRSHLVKKYGQGLSRR